MAQRQTLRGGTLDEAIDALLAQMISLGLELAPISRPEVQRRLGLTSRATLVGDRGRRIESARIAMTRKTRRGGKVWITIFPDKPVTKKPAETRMGSGKGSPEGWVAVVKRGRVMFELAGVPEPLAKEALRLAGQKLPIKTKFVKREADLFES